MTKRELRQQLHQAVAPITPEELHHRSIQACSLITSTKEYKKAEVIMVFLSLPTEIDTTSLVMHAWRDLKRVLAPRVSWEQRRMLPTEIQSLSDDVKESPLGIREPAQGMPFPVVNIDLLIVPGIGFDLHGNRIGRGRGFYDRFLAHRDWRGVACGLALEEQVVDYVPTEALDMPMDMLVTDRAIRRFSNRTAINSHE